ncbi:helix-turn-helix domain-containing protein [Herbiconiux sp. 11R-BC]|uniref:winged helix-turn-helix transcriptional regulator n=1 Tax=Herbiconiux sp. 11R-BC TaxID=3111637 RepID=UPI003BFC3411
MTSGESGQGDAAALDGPNCQIVRTLDVIGEKWSILIVRDAMRGISRFSEFRASLGAPSDILTARLAKLVAAGVLEKRSYREAGSRERFSYHLTESGLALKPVLGALLQWGDSFVPYAGGAASVAVQRESREPVSVAFVTPDGHPLAAADVDLAPGPAARRPW